jgi:hypothetical protein
MAFGALAWRKILSLLRVSVSRIVAVRIVFLSQLARYLPGNIGHHLGKIVLGHREGIGVKVGSGSIIIESLGLLVLGLSLSALFLPDQLKVFLLGAQHVPLLVGAVVVVLLILFILYRRGKLLAVLQQFKQLRLDASLREYVGAGVEVVFCYLINFIFLGVIAWLIADRVYGTPAVSVFQLTGIFALSWTAGFVTPGAPAGLGVREVIALALLTNSYGEEVAIGVVVLHRMVLTAGDLFAFILGLLLQLAASRSLPKFNAIEPNDEV